MDTLVGTAGNDTFNASVTATSAVLGGLDSVDGGAGTDTLNIADTATAANADFALPTGMTIKNIEVLNVTTNGAIGKGGATDFNVSTMSGLTTFAGVAAGTGSGTGSQVKAAGTTDVSLTVAGTATSTVNGGKTVAITGGGVATVNDAAGQTGTTLTSVSLTNVGTLGGVTSVLTGNGISSVTLAGIAATANTITVTNATVGHALTINAAGTGYTTTAATSAAATAVNDTAATSLTINTSAKSAVNASGSTAVKSVTLTGAGALNLTAMGATTTSIDGSAATGALTLNTLNAAAVAVKTGSGNDTMTLSATTKATVDSGAGNDTVTLGAILAAGSSVNLGAGNDKLLGVQKPALSTATLVTVIDGGDGTDTVSAGLINNGNAAQFINFEIIGLEGATTLDLTLMTGSTITGLELISGGGTYTGATLAQSLAVNTNAAGATSIAFSGATGAADSYAINFGATSTGTAANPTSIDAGTLTLAGVEIFNVASGATSGVSANKLALTAAQAQQINITGDQELNLTFAGTNGTIVNTVGGVSSIDGSAATGKLAINVASVTKATAGLTVKGGTAADTLTTSTFSTSLTGNGGNDNFVVAATIAGTDDAATAAITTITDFTKGDTITFVNASGTTTFTTTKVDVAAAVSLDAAVNLATATNVAADAAAVKWFQYGGNTFVVQDLSSATELATGDVIVKLTGLLDLSTASVTTGAGADVLSWA